MRLDIQLITAAVLSVGGLVLLFCGVFIAPQGEVHESLPFRWEDAPPNQNEQGS